MGPLMVRPVPPFELTLELPVSVMAPDRIPGPAALSMAPPPIETALPTFAPLLIVSTLVPTVIATVPAAAVAPSMASVPPLMLVPPP